MQRRKFVVGLAGTVASGKSTVAELFRKFGAQILDADAIAHQALERADVRRALARTFGRHVLTDGRVDRRRLAERAFSSPAQVRRLNAIVHPHVKRGIRALLGRAHGVLILDAPLLQEAGADAWCDRVVFVDAPRRVRLARAAARGWPAGELRRRERLQWSPARKRAGADRVIDNGGSRAATGRRVRALYREFVETMSEVQRPIK